MLVTDEQTKWSFWSAEGAGHKGNDNPPVS